MTQTQSSTESAVQPYATPPSSTQNTPERAKPFKSCDNSVIPSLEFVTTIRSKPTFDIPLDLTQATVEANPVLKRLQQDLLILTSFNDNSTLCWRPSWFKESALPTPFLRFWTLHNPPNVVTEPLPYRSQSRPTMTRRMRQDQDAEPFYMRSWDAWVRYCDLYGVPYDFLCEDQVRLLQLGLPRDTTGSLLQPPTWPLYPEPLPCPQGSYILDSSTYHNLPPKFQQILDPMCGQDLKYVIVHTDGTMSIQVLNVPAKAFRQGPGRRWSHIPWTVQQQKSCEPTRLKLRFWNSAISSSDVHLMDCT